MAKKKMRLGEFLVDKKIISEKDLNRALKQQEQWGGRIGEALIKLNIISEDKLLAALRYNLGIPVVDLKGSEIPKNIVSLFSKKMAEKYMAVPVKLMEEANKKVLLVAMSNPMDMSAIEEIQFALGLRVQPVLARSKDINFSLHHHYDIPVGYEAEKGVSPQNRPDSNGMTIITGGGEIKIDEIEEFIDEEVVEERVIEFPEEGSDAEAEKVIDLPEEVDGKYEEAKSDFTTPEEKDYTTKKIPSVEDIGLPPIEDIKFPEKRAEPLSDEKGTASIPDTPQGHVIRDHASTEERPKAKEPLPRETIEKRDANPGIGGNTAFQIEVLMKDRKLFRALVKLLIEKGYITTQELQDEFRGDE